ncbi:MAG: TIGR01777 family protein [Leptolyngbya sp. SIO3F4]|nr:TIGR01777 family protein [Leptolyngbya sp. SIO3F4]
MEKVVVFGGTGFIGRSLARYLTEKGMQPIIVGRNRPEDLRGVDFLPWDGVTVGEWASALEGVRAIVNLAGKTVDCIKTPDNCDLILRSRLDTTRAIGKALQTVTQRPPVWVQMSTAHIYGDPPKQVCTEASAFGYGLAPFVGQAWEEALRTSLSEGMREVRLRTSFVVGRNGGALKSLKQITRLGLGGTAGNGKQGFSWIHEHDMNEIIYRSITEDEYRGAYIASAPNPVSNREFMQILRKVMRVPIGLPAPALAIRFGAKFLFGTDPELVLYGRYVRPERLEQQGFTFAFPKLEEALRDLIR